ncbi:MAG: hypothetical protein LQ340_003971 [Diploschistes diacapsis]|nr:MAG: hypothetical protein LQ340_003971 [Diploschistes diacapsis]
MHSSLVRVQNVFGFFTTVTFSVAGLIALSVLFFPQSPSASVQVRNVQVIKGRPNYYSSKREEYAHIKFDLEAGSSLYRLPSTSTFSLEFSTYPADPRRGQLCHPFPLPPSPFYLADSHLPQQT